MTTTNGFFLEMSTFFRKMTTSNEARDSVLDVDDVQTSSNIFDDDDDGQSWSIITPYLGVLAPIQFEWKNQPDSLILLLSLVCQVNFLPLKYFTLFGPDWFFKV